MFLSLIEVFFVVLPSLSSRTLSPSACGGVRRSHLDIGSCADQQLTDRPRSASLPPLSPPPLPALSFYAAPRIMMTVLPARDFGRRSRKGDGCQCGLPFCSVSQCDSPKITLSTSAAHAIATNETTLRLHVPHQQEAHIHTHTHTHTHASVMCATPRLAALTPRSHVERACSLLFYHAAGYGLLAGVYSVGYFASPPKDKWEGHLDECPAQK
jgi:hypothetical protein